MGHGTASDWAERAVDVAAAALFAAAIAFAARTAAMAGPPAIAAVAATGFLLAYAILRRLPAAEPEFDLPNFALSEFEPVAVPERSAELLLDDKLGELEPDARVVRLFDPAPAPAGASEPLDASEALSHALEELRRSLR